MNYPIHNFQGSKRRGGVPGNGEENIPEHPGRAARPERGGVGRAAQAGVARPPARRAARRARPLRLLAAPPHAADAPHARPAAFGPRRDFGTLREFYSGIVKKYCIFSQFLKLARRLPPSRANL